MACWVRRGRYFAPANGPDGIERIANGYGDCGVLSLMVTYPMVKNFDLRRPHEDPVEGDSDV